MAHKHNRRRIRPRNRRLTSGLSSSPNLASSLPQSPLDEPDIQLLSTAYLPGIPRRTGPTSLWTTQVFGKSTDLTARHWQNRYISWQRREKAQKDEAMRLEAEQCRLFGGEPGDDISLCYKMLAYFDSMDYINT